MITNIALTVIFSLSTYISATFIAVLNLAWEITMHENASARVALFHLSAFYFRDHHARCLYPCCAAPPILIFSSPCFYARRIKN